MRRADRQLAEPTRSLTDFPRCDLSAGQTVYRSHTATNGAWWFASAKADPDDGGRFDLVAPDGTCYVAVDAETAARERFGEQIIDAGYVFEEDVAAVRISRLELQEDASAADTTHRRAANWITRELAAIDNYELTQEWAAAFAAAGFDALIYYSRFTTAGDQLAIALFGPAGTRAWPVVGEEDVREVLEEAGVTIVSVRPIRALKRSTRLDETTR